MASTPEKLALAREKAKGKSGRKKAQHTIQSEALRAYLIKQVIKERNPLIQALITKAKTGDVPALKEVFERVLGKVKDTVDVNIKTFAEIINKLDD